ncbi:MAG: hypothetical protein A2W25_14980 [candidate division Zixibacteria bacterium RBG_16_53_22]|nr:MAG: hypothetical protein A2W25_14980 [candidate division Zixibacteria bacterium RBG_16_53_22]
MTLLQSDIDNLINSNESIKEGLRIFEIGQAEYEKALELLNFTTIKTASSSNEALITPLIY